MQIKLIVESGATKTDFCLLGGKEHIRFRLDGINLATMSEEYISTILERASEKLAGYIPAGAIGKVYFYGAGIVPPSSVKSSESENIRKLDNLLCTMFGPKTTIEYNSDLTASARALWGDRPGISVILGTGSNSCLYDGKKIVANVRPCGFIIGDFGSGAALGKSFLADFLQNQMPGELAGRFEKDSGLDYQSVVKAVYGGEAPARFLASFAPYILSLSEANDLEDCSLDYIKELITDNFRIFIRRCLLQYNPSVYSAGVTGSFGCAAREFLEKAGAEFGVRFTTFLPSPLDGLIKYHSDYV